jgi:hypothetical protein|tara:strand:+ start:214 stop:810 length:597 start_codon:yes stop_codon:yes gene_type:complete
MEHINKTKTNTISLKTYRKLSVEIYGKDVGNMVYDYWELINNKFWNNKLKPILITFEVMPYGMCDAITQDRHIRIQTTLRFKDVVIEELIHEMIHQARGELIDNNKLNKLYIKYDKKFQKGEMTSHNEPFWIESINRIYFIATGKELGAGFKKKKRIKGGGLTRVTDGKLEYKEICEFPSGKYLKEIINYLDKVKNIS